MRDFVEFLSQFFELVAFDEDLLTQFAQDYKTGEVMPQEMREKIRAAQTFDMGYQTAEYLISAFIDMEWHSLRAGETKTVAEIEQAVAQKLGIPDIVQARHKSTHFGHITGGYAAGYKDYAYSDSMVATVAETFHGRGGFSLPETAHCSRWFMPPETANIRPF